MQPQVHVITKTGRDRLRVPIAIKVCYYNIQDSLKVERAFPSVEGVL